MVRISTVSTQPTPSFVETVLVLKPLRKFIDSKTHSCIHEADLFSELTVFMSQCLGSLTLGRWFMSWWERIIGIEDTHTKVTRHGHFVFFTF